MCLFCVCECLKSVGVKQFSDIGGIPIKHIHQEHLPKSNLESPEKHSSIWDICKNHIVFPSPLPKHSMYWSSIQPLNYPVLLVNRPAPLNIWVWESSLMSPMSRWKSVLDMFPEDARIPWNESSTFGFPNCGEVATWITISATGTKHVNKPSSSGKTSSHTLGLELFAFF